MNTITHPAYSWHPINIYHNRDNTHKEIKINDGDINQNKIDGTLLFGTIALMVVITVFATIIINKKI